MKARDPNRWTNSDPSRGNKFWNNWNLNPMTIVHVDLTSMGFDFRADSKYLNDIQAIQRSLALIFRAEMAGVLLPDSSFFWLLFPFFFDIFHRYSSSTRLARHFEPNFIAIHPFVMVFSHHHLGESWSIKINPHGPRSAKTLLMRIHATYLYRRPYW